MRWHLCASLRPSPCTSYQRIVPFDDVHSIPQARYSGSLVRNLVSERSPFDGLDGRIGEDL